MAKKTFLIKSVLEGHSPSAYFGKHGQFLASVGIDPGLPVSSSVIDKPSGAIVPTRYETFSSTAVNSTPMWLENTTKNELTYAYLANGRLISYDSSLASETNIGTPTNGNGSGFKYYDNYLYMPTTTDVARYGPLDGVASITSSYWQGTLSKTALVNTTYPSIRSFTFPNHAMHVHYGKLYFLDFKDNIGRVHFIQTTTTTVGGDTDNGSTYNALLLPQGYLPFDIESYGADLIILCTPVGATSPTIRQGKAILFFWDTFSSKPYRGVELSDTLGTALLTHNGVPHVWSGSLEKGVRLSRYLGGNQFESLLEFSEGTPPTAGAVDSLGNRIIWGGWGTKPLINVGVYAMGYIDSRLPSRALNQVAHVPVIDSLQIVSALKYVQQSTNPNQPLVGWRTGSSNYGISKPSSTASFGNFSIWQSEIINVGQPFAVTKIRLPLGAAVASNMTITPSIYVDDLSSSTTLDNLNSTNYPNSERNAVYNINVSGNHNFMIQLSFTNTVILPVLLPIEITIETFKD